MQRDTDKRYTRIILDVLAAHGVKDIVASPGSRNAPLLISTSYRDEFNTRIIPDERTASFVALGIAMVTRKPVAIICTSGTALYNYGPALAEAFYQGVPLIVLSADRPNQWIDQNDSQTLIQPDALEKITKKSYDIEVESENKELDWYVNRTVNEAVLLAQEAKEGPVHINIRYDSPLSNTIECAEKDERIIYTIIPKPTFTPAVLNDLKRRLEGKKVLVVVGFMQPDAELNKYLRLFSTLPGVVIVCETISNLHLPGNPYAIDSVLSGLDDARKRKLRPDIVISLGGALVSRILKEFIRNQAPEVWTLGDSFYGIDTFKHLSLNIRISPSYFFKIMYYALMKKYEKTEEPQKQSVEYTICWEETKIAQLKLREEFVDNIGWSELKAFRYILTSLPSHFNLYLSNGTSVRYAQLFTTNIPHASYSNRGVSGIEGTSSTAAGCAMASKNPTLLITGDLSFAYNPGVMQLEGLPHNFKIIVINNRGGGIFRFISPTRYVEHRDRFFCADPEVPVEGLATAYGWKYFKATDEHELESAYHQLLDSSSNSILEIIANEEYSASILRKYMRLNAYLDK